MQSFPSSVDSWLKKERVSFIQMQGLPEDRIFLGFQLRVIQHLSSTQGFIRELVLYFSIKGSGCSEEKSSTSRTRIFFPFSLSCLQHQNKGCSCLGCVGKDTKTNRNPLPSSSSLACFWSSLRVLLGAHTWA